MTRSTARIARRPASTATIAVTPETVGSRGRPALPALDPPLRCRADVPSPLPSPAAGLRAAALEERSALRPGAAGRSGAGSAGAGAATSATNGGASTLLERGDAGRVELRLVAQQRERALGRPGRAVDAVRDERVVDVADGEDARLERRARRPSARAGSPSRRAARGGRARGAGRRARSRRARAAGARRPAGACGSPRTRRRRAGPASAAPRTGPTSLPMSCSSPPSASPRRRPRASPSASPTWTASIATRRVWPSVAASFSPSRTTSARTRAPRNASSLRDEVGGASRSPTSGSEAAARRRSSAAGHAERDHAGELEPVADVERELRERDRHLRDEREREPGEPDDREQVRRPARELPGADGAQRDHARAGRSRPRARRTRACVPVCGALGTRRGKASALDAEREDGGGDRDLRAHEQPDALRAAQRGQRAESASTSAPAGSEAAPANATTPFVPTSTPGVASPCTASSAVIVENAVPSRTVRPSRRRAPATLRIADAIVAASAAAATSAKWVPARRPRARPWPTPSPRPGSRPARRRPRRAAASGHPCRSSHPPDRQGAPTG